MKKHQIILMIQLNKKGRNKMKQIKKNNSLKKKIAK